MGTTLHQKMNERLTEAGCNGTVFVPLCERDSTVIEPAENVIVSKCFKHWHRFLFSYKQLNIFKGLEKKLNCEHFDCIHAYTLFTDGNVAMKLSKKYGKPYVVAIRNTDINDFFKKLIHLRPLGIKIMRNASAIFFLSEAYREYMFKKYIPKRYHEELLKKTHIIPNGIDDFWFKNAPFNASKNPTTEGLSLIYAGRIDKNKNITTTQRAVDALNQKGYNVKLTVVGNVADEAEFNIIKKHPFTQVLPAMPKEALIHEYRKNDIFVMPSYTETFGLVYAEAMSQGLPILYSKGQGFDKQFAEGEAGYSVNPYSFEDVAEKIEKIIEDYSEISAKCPALSRKFNWEDMCEKYIEIYKSVIRK